MNTVKIFYSPEQISFKKNSSFTPPKEKETTVKINNTLVKLSVDNYQAYYLTFAGIKNQPII